MPFAEVFGANAGASKPSAFGPDLALAPPADKALASFKTPSIDNLITTLTSGAAGSGKPKSVALSDLGMPIGQADPLASELKLTDNGIGLNSILGGDAVNSGSPGIQPGSSTPDVASIGGATLPASLSARPERVIAKGKGSDLLSRILGGGTGSSKPSPKGKLDAPITVPGGNKSSPKGLDLAGAAKPSGNAVSSGLGGQGSAMSSTSPKGSLGDGGAEGPSWARRNRTALLVAALAPLLLGGGYAAYRAMKPKSDKKEDKKEEKPKKKEKKASSESQLQAALIFQAIMEKC